MCLLASQIIFHIHENSAESLGPKYSIVHLPKNTKIWLFLCEYHYLAQRWTPLLKSYAFGIIRKLDVNQYIFPYPFNQTSAMWVILSVIISQEPFTPLKIRIMCLIRSQALTASRPTLPIVVIQSDHSYCQVVSSAYFLYI